MTASRPVTAGPTDGWEVPGALAGERLDRALALLSGLSRRDVNVLLDDGRVRVGRRVITSHHHRVEAGQRVTVEGPMRPPGPGLPVADPAVEVPVVWSDEDVIVVDKPAGLVVHPGAGHRSGTLVHGLLARFAGLADAGDPDRPGIVHRLDKGTSGLLVVARTDAARDALVGQLSRREVERQYVALVNDIVEEDEGLIDAPLGRADRDPTRMRVQAGGRLARTRYQVEDRFDRPVPATLLRCRLETGRTHQIRVHLASIGHPVVNDIRYGDNRYGDNRYGDKRYGDKRYGDKRYGDKRYGPPVDGWPPLPPDRPFLHAAALAFDHPRTGERMSFTSDLPVDLLGVIRGMSPAARL
jgi:23S rRNA pseudouridine1911/1915/1917 synthase